MNQTQDPTCINETGGKTCVHPRSEHDSGGCCRAMWCPCSHFRQIAEFDPLLPTSPKSIP